MRYVVKTPLSDEQAVVHPGRDWILRKMAFLIYLLALTLMAGLPARGWAAAGDLDASFGGDGKVVTHVGTSCCDDAQKVAIQSDGKIVVSGWSVSGAYEDFTVVRYNTDGSLDATFGDSGKVVTPIQSGDSNDRPYGMLIQPDGKIVLSGISFGADYDFVVVRYSTDGSLDPTFGGNGKVGTLIGVGNAYSGSGIAIQPDGKIVVSASASNGSDNDFVVLRYNTDGSLDPTFGDSGKVVMQIGTNDDLAYGLAIQPDGKIAVSGSTWNGSDYDFVVVRYNTDGSLDPTFGDSGKVVIPIGDLPHPWPTGLAIQTDNKIVVAGTRDSWGVGLATAVVRLDANGVLDQTFGVGGRIFTSLGSFLSGLAIDATGKIMVTEQVSTGVNPQFALVRYNADGSLDTAFFKPLGGYSLAHGVAVQADGKIVVSGASCDFFDPSTVCSFATVRYLGGPVCEDEPITGCLTATKSRIALNKGTFDTKDKMSWKWTNTVSLTQMDFADPIAGGTGYALCIYAGIGNALIAEASLLPGVGWSALGTRGYKLTASGRKFNGASPDGLTSATLRDVPAGSRWRWKALVKGRGAALPDPLLPLGRYPVIVQFKKSSSSLCLQSTFGAADEIKNDGTQFKAMTQ